MADIDIQRRSHRGWLWLLGLLALGLLGWLLFAGDDDDAVATAAPAAVVADPGAVAVPPAPPEAVAGTAVPIPDILANPAEWSGRMVSGEARVAEAVSDRGFWIEAGGRRLFVVRDESPRPGVADVQGKDDSRDARSVTAGDMIQIGGVLRTSAAQVRSPLDAQARQIIARQPVFMTTTDPKIWSTDGD